MRLRLLLLDFDGTLADTRRAHYRAYAQAFAEAGHTLTEEEYATHYFGMRCGEFLRAKGIVDPDEADRIRRRKIALYPAFFDEIRLNEPLWNFCRSFRRQGGRVWVVSTGQRENLRNALRHLRLEAEIDGLITGSDVVRSKPAPDPFLEAMAREGVSPAETLIFEDSPVGIEAARRSGAPYVVVKLD